MKKALTLPENEFPAWVKVGAMSVPSSFSTRFISCQGFFRLRHDMQRVGHDHYIKGLVRIGQAEHILHGEVQLGRAVIPLRLGDHLRRGVRRLDVRRRVYDVFCDQSRAGRQLQHRFMPHNWPDQLIHLVIRRPILRIKRSYRPAFLSQKSLCSCIAIIPFDVRLT